MKNYIGQKLKLKEMPNLYYGNPNLTVGSYYLITEIEGSNFWLVDDDGKKCTFGQSRFELN